MAAGGVDVWWMRGREIAAPSDRPMHCQAIGFASGIPASWRAGERQRFLTAVMRRYPEDDAPAPGRAAAWRLNGGNGRHMSLSDSGTHLAVAIAHGVPVGIDIERNRPVDDALATLRRLGLDDLVRRMSDLPPAARNRVFLKIWTAFESFLKLERLKWEAGAERFAALSPHWRIGQSGSVQFTAGERTGLFFEHSEPSEDFVLCAVMAAPATVAVRRLNLGTRVISAAKL